MMAAYDWDKTSRDVILNIGIWMQLLRAGLRINRFLVKYDTRRNRKLPSHASISFKRDVRGSERVLGHVPSAISLLRKVKVQGQDAWAADANININIGAADLTIRAFLFRVAGSSPRSRKTPPKGLIENPSGGTSRPPDQLIQIKCQPTPHPCRRFPHKLQRRRH
ncbi:hypothetical protein B0H11DRAFT_1927009 [Mycena galericulata]|nr:hypothetical protein B0H11DRAFT_1927009 [Mycena galericulata]